MIPEIGILTVIGLALSLALYAAKWLYERNSAKRKAQDEINKKIDAAAGADDIMRVSGELRDK